LGWGKTHSVIKEEVMAKDKYEGMEEMDRDTAMMNDGRIKKEKKKKGK